MASRSLKKLTPEVEDKARNVQEYCKDYGVSILIYCTLRTLEEQAVLYRQSNKLPIILDKMEELNKRGFVFLSDIIENVGPQKMIAWRTNAAPGESFHAYGEAFDAVPVLAGKLIWNYDDYKEGWNIYGDALKENKLTWGGVFNEKYIDIPHAQLRPGSNPLKVYPPEVIKAILTENGLINDEY